MDWETKRIKDFATLITEKTSIENKVALENIEEATGKFIETDSEFEGGGIHFIENDVLYGKLRPYLRKVWLSDTEGNAVGDIFVFRNKNNSNPKFLKWLFLSEDFTSKCNGSTQGAKMPRVDSNFILTLSYKLPPLSSQLSIVNFLDQKTQNIDARIEILEKKKEYYILLRKAIINEAVNHVGTDWKCCRMKDIGYLYSGLSGKSGEDFQDDENINNKSFIPFTNIFNNDVINPQQLGHVIMLPDEEQNKVKKNDLFFLMSSEDYDGLGKNSLLKDELEDTYLNSFCKGFRITSKIIYPDFLNYLLQSFDYRNKLKIEGKGFTRMNLKSEKISCFTIRYPDIQIQKNIVKMLDKKTTQIDDIIKNIDYQTDTLKTYRRALINEAVTGKLNIE